MERIVNLTTPTLVKPKIVYPESDGKPMGETEVHIKAMAYLSIVTTSCAFFVRSLTGQVVTTSCAISSECGQQRLNGFFQSELSGLE